MGLNSSPYDYVIYVALIATFVHTIAHVANHYLQPPVVVD